MNLPSFRTFFLVTALAAFPATLPAAEDAKKSDESSRNAWIFNVDFPGGTIEQLVKAISADGSAIFNVVGEKADLATPIPAFSLRNADGESLSNAINQMIAARGLNLNRAQGPSMSGRQGLINYPIYVLTRRNVIDRPASASFQLGRYLEKQSIDDIVTAIRTLWELNPANRPEALQLKYHPATKLLLASGTPEAIDVAGKVIATLAGPPPVDPVAEQKRLEGVADEVLRRREVREKSGQAPAKAEPKSAPKP